MNALLDTHAFLWWVIDDPQLSNTAKAIITEPTNTIYFSVVSAWEIIIKERTGKLSLPESPEAYIPSRLASNRFVTLTVEMHHVLQIALLPNHHRDPFDRLLIAQSQIENLPLLTVDHLISQYSVNVIW
ncbi:MAG: type II toxin-antitoxin system VapC family toxin [Leptolyngbyaceae cyanobacterium CSU_1_3]|nr:type II toxin-antitoxin system VapC family toxin [Leptolyngbyaceae cyanobacterium CSU_1_3]